MRVDRLELAESAMHLGCALAFAGIALASIPVASTGAALVLASSAWAGLETARDEVTRWDTPRRGATRYTPRHGVDTRHASAPVNRRVR